MLFTTDCDLHRGSQHSPTFIASFVGPVETVPKISEEPFQILEDIFTATAACVLQSPRRHRHVFEGCSLGATRANPAFGKPNTFTHSQGSVPSVRVLSSGRVTYKPSLREVGHLTDSQAEVANPRFDDHDTLSFNRRRLCVVKFAVISHPDRQGCGCGRPCPLLQQ